MQPEFKFIAAIPPEHHEVKGLCEWLAAKPGWHTAKSISKALFLDDRKIRQLAEHSNGQIVSGPGCPGYKHFDHCTTAELSRVAAQLASQGRTMIKRSIRLQKKAHASI